MCSISRCLALGFFILAAFLSSGCGYSIQYALNREEITVAEKPIPLKVEVAPLADKRASVERQKDARDKQGQSDLSDYTYDSEFKGEVSTEITKMMVDHLNFSGIFSPAVKLATFNSRDLTDLRIDSLKQAGVDGILTGDLTHFYGYYDQNIGRKILYAVPLGVASGMLLNWSMTSGNMQYTWYWYGPGLAVGYYLESLHSRHIEYETHLHARLISTSTRQNIWEQDFNVSYSGEKKMPGLNSEQRKFEVAISSLRDAVNQMVTGLSKDADFILERKDKAMVQLPNQPVAAVEQKSLADQQPMPQQSEWAQPLLKEKGFRYGVLGGVNVATMSGGDMSETKSVTGFSIGGYFNYHFDPQFALQAELMYSTKGAKYETNEMGFPSQSTISLNYLDVPILGVFYPLENIKLYAGPSFNFFLGGKEEAELQSTFMDFQYASKMSLDLSADDVNSPEIGLVLGGGYASGILEIGGRYALGLTNSMKGNRTTGKNRMFQILIGVSF
ncbi:MAG: porin family protein [bacterium]